MDLYVSRYRFKADVYGTGWYHSHYSAQYLSGVAGPMVIYGPTHTQFDEDLGPILLSDCKSLTFYSEGAHLILSGFHTPYFPLMQDSKFEKGRVISKAN